MGLSHANRPATGSCVWTALPAAIIVRFSSKCTRTIETIQVKVIGATVTIAIPILTTVASPKKNNVTSLVPRKIAALWFAENAYRRRTTPKAFSRQIMVVVIGVEEVEVDIMRKND